MTIRVLLADDQALIRAGFKAIVDATDGMTVVGEASTGAEAVALARSSRAEVVLMDIRMPDMDGIEATRRITNDDDLAGVRVLLLTTFELDDLVIEGIRAGASGFLGKSVDPGDLLDAIRVIAAGDALLSPRATSGLLAQLASNQIALPAVEPLEFKLLTARERELTTLVATGMSNDEIAAQLHLSTLTVKTHVNRAMSKLGARDRAQLVVIAYEGGLVQAGRNP
jgi:DNA-binding NarL/FixJ family response regulator